MSFDFGLLCIEMGWLGSSTPLQPSLATANRLLTVRQRSLPGTRTARSTDERAERQRDTESSKVKQGQARSSKQAEGKRTTRQQGFATTTTTSIHPSIHLFRETERQTESQTDGNNEQQTSNNKHQTTNIKQQTSNNKQQTTNNKQQTTNNKQPNHALPNLIPTTQHNPTQPNLWDVGRGTCLTFLTDCGVGVRV